MQGRLKTATGVSLTWRGRARRPQPGRSTEALMRHQPFRPAAAASAAIALAVFCSAQAAGARTSAGVPGMAAAKPSRCVTFLTFGPRAPGRGVFPMVGAGSRALTLPGAGSSAGRWASDPAEQGLARAEGGRDSADRGAAGRRDGHRDGHRDHHCGSARGTIRPGIPVQRRRFRQVRQPLPVAAGLHRRGRHVQRASRALLGTRRVHQATTQETQLGRVPGRAAAVLGQR